MPFTQKAQVTALTWPLLLHYSRSGKPPSVSAGDTPAPLDVAGGR
jgi:hypothetical protein